MSSGTHTHTHTLTSPPWCCAHTHTPSTVQLLKAYNTPYTAARIDYRRVGKRVDSTAQLEPLLPRQRRRKWTHWCGAAVARRRRLQAAAILARSSPVDCTIRKFTFNHGRPILPLGQCSFTLSTSL